ncbi:class I SAM-dependent methyltransferase [Cohnella panacarvi]|uniref:class I SAM-dependent methyltransferase n=1 Tax=Cohnella panacarvi TaxID=400776 RepID=UPI00047A2495|nr:class I SAM-dependent methyltransferase [Cohnella panacarvi]
MANTDKFEMIAGTYDTPERIRIAKASAEAIREYIIDAKSKSAIDFGCGTGLVGMNLLDEFRAMLFLDTSPGMIDQIKRKITESAIRNAETMIFDFEKEGLGDVRADYIFMAQVLLHIPDVQPVLTRLYEVLNDGGHLLIVDFDKNDKVSSELVHTGFNQNELADLMTAIGFKDIHSRTFLAGERIFMGQDASMFVLDSSK